MWQALRQAAEGGGSESRPGEALDTLQSPQDDPCYYCRLCGALITRRDARISVQGSHEQRFSNPAGYVFDIGCFRSAPGCLRAGDPNTFYSWFDGFAWCYAVCRSCGTHLGWAFSARSARSADSFFGLILNRLLAGPPPSAPGKTAGQAPGH
jgi:hypothetical protein